MSNHLSRIPKTTALGSALDLSSPHAVGAGERVFAFDTCNHLIGATISVRIAAPALSPALFILVAGILALLGATAVATPAPRTLIVYKRNAAAVSTFE